MLRRTPFPKQVNSNPNDDVLEVVSPTSVAWSQQPPNFVEFDDVPFSPAGEQHVVCAATPSGFGAPVYVDGPKSQPHDVFRRLHEGYPQLPRELKSGRRAQGRRAARVDPVPP